jgi:hypothetical protein
VLVAIAQVLLCGLVLRDGSRRSIACSMLVNAGTALLWAIVRTWGLPFGLTDLEPIGLIDSSATAAEVVAVAAGVALLLRQRPVVAAASALLGRYGGAMWWQIGPWANAVVAIAYLLIVAAVLRPLIRDGLLRTAAAIVSDEQ